MPIVFNDHDLRNLPKMGDGTESKLLYLLLNEVPQTYKPRDTVLAMSVGTGTLSLEGSLIREFHRLRFGKHKKDVIVIGCDILDRYQKEEVAEDYALEIRGRQGDASTDAPWRFGMITGIESYDHIHINFPNLMGEYKTWVDILKKSHSFLSKNGVITIIAGGESDSKALKEACKELSKDITFRVSAVKQYRHRIGLGYAFSHIQRNPLP